MASPLGKWYAMSSTQQVKNLPAMQEIQVQSLSREDPLEKGMTIHFNILAWRSPWGHKELDTNERLNTHIHPVLCNILLCLLIVFALNSILFNMCCYPGFLFYSIYMEHLFLFLHFKFVCVPKSAVMLDVISEVS